MERIIPTDVRVLLEGESGTGKERIARIIHYNGPRQNAPFVAVDCGALPASLLESELFGYVKGAFTGAEKDRKGLFEEANTGTLFLDEIANMPSEIQAKFLRAIQEGEIRPVGSSQVVKVNVRIIAAVSGDLKAKVDKGEFREDLFYRLNVVNFPLPPLRERKEDIAMLAHHFLKQMNEKYDKKIKGFKPNTIAALESYPWPGNIRELEHAIERAVVLGESDRLSQKDFPFLESPAVVNNELFKPRYLQDALNEFKREYISQILQQTGGNQKQAAEILNIQRTYLNRLIKELEIKQ
ncbi:AAA domain-containing protein [Candidatus Saccharibacteria bacterium]|nr:AAA domain-containing protein [Calditrichia bacterium]NIV98255.1 AAA domain-containing protein [Candidatus Saccharibacteria bacterium]NIW80566.1 AAA domain-containing protein [Calditrichia bacterium]